MSEPPDPKKPTLWQVIASVNAAFLGVQNSKNRERDFTHGKASHYIIVGLIMTVLFVGVLVLIVKLMLHNAGL